MKVTNDKDADEDQLITNINLSGKKELSFKLLYLIINLS